MSIVPVFQSDNCDEEIGLLIHTPFDRLRCDFRLRHNVDYGTPAAEAIAIERGQESLRNDFEQLVRSLRHTKSERTVK